jgi:hypothetical protein
MFSGWAPASSRHSSNTGASRSTGVGWLSSSITTATWLSGATIARKGGNPLGASRACRSTLDKSLIGGGASIRASARRCHSRGSLSSSMSRLSQGISTDVSVSSFGTTPFWRFTLLRIPAWLQACKETTQGGHRQASEHRHLGHHAAQNEWPHDQGAATAESQSPVNPLP